jgi:hypothetical protein
VRERLAIVDGGVAPPRVAAAHAAPCSISQHVHRPGVQPVHRAGVLRTDRCEQHGVVRPLGAGRRRLAAWLAATAHCYAGRRRDDARAAPARGAAAAAAAHAAKTYVEYEYRYMYGWERCLHMV